MTELSGVIPGAPLEAGVTVVPPPFSGNSKRKGRGFGLHLPGSRFTVTEVLAILLALLMTGGSLAVFFSGVTLWRLVLGVDDGGAGEVVGRLEREAGKVRRQRVRSTEFLPLEASSEVFTNDFIVTGSDSSATITLSDGGVIELGASTLVRLTFDSSLSLGGVVRGTRIELVEGEVSGQAGAGQLKVRSREGVTDLDSGSRSRVKAIRPALVIPKIPVPVAPVPVPPIPVTAAPAPAVAAVSGSRDLEVVRSSLGTEQAIAPVVEKGKVVGKLPVNFEISGELSEEFRKRPPLLQIVRADNGRPARPRLVPLRWGEGRVLTGELSLIAAGAHVWKLIPAQGVEYTLRSQGVDAPLEGRLTVGSDVVGIEVLAPRIGGRELKDNQYSGGSLLRESAEGLELRWKLKQAVRASKFEVALFDRASLQAGASEAVPRVTLASDQTSVLLRDSAIIGKPVRIQVRAALEGGFNLVSEPYDYEFRVQAPVLATPKSNAELSVKALAARGDGAVLLTWKRTHFTDRYELQLATDPGFQRRVAGGEIEENFYVWSSPKPGKYWWRVRGRTAGAYSEYSTSSVLVLKP